MQLDHTDILRILPHRPPFLFIDRVIDITPGEKGTGIKRLSADELLLSAHTMVLPNILHLEIMAQTAAMICASMAPISQKPGDLSLHASLGMGYLAGADINFIDPKTALAGDTIEARVEIIKLWSPFIMAQGSIFIDDKELSRARFTIALA
jgi:3-hydroxymyristoyl/3-hydroxydecanoyl-(acyl carrier protein) dehydratase